MMTHCGLALLDQAAQVGYVKFAVSGEVEEDSKPRLVAEKLECLRELEDRLVGQRGKREAAFAVGLGPDVGSGVASWGHGENHLQAAA
jgi:hypothetical protein